MDSQLPRDESENVEASIATQKAWEVHMYLRQFEDCIPNSEQAKIAGEHAVRAFEGLMTEVHDIFQGYVINLTKGNPIDTEEIHQESQVRVFKGLKNFRGDAQVTTWMFPIVQRVASTYYERKARHAKHLLYANTGEYEESESLFGEASPDYYTDPETHVIDKEHNTEIYELVHAALEDMTPTNKNIALWWFGHRIPQAQIAARLGLTEGAVKVRASRIKSVLAKKLHREVDTELT